MITIDLTREIYDNLPVFPGDRDVLLNQTHQVDRDGYSNFAIDSGLHIGTHIDSPAHFVASGDRIHQLPLEKLCGKAIALRAKSADIIDIDIIPDGGIDEELIVVICTGYYKHFGTEDYYNNYPVISRRLSEYFVEKKVKMVALDSPSPDKSPYEIHGILLGAGIIIAENLVNTEEILDKGNLQIYALPMKVRACGAPARIIAQY